MTTLLATLTAAEQAAVLPHLAADETVVSTYTFGVFIHVAVRKPMAAEKGIAYRVEHRNINMETNAVTVVGGTNAIEWAVEATILTAYNASYWGRMVEFETDGQRLRVPVDGLIVKAARKELVKRAKANRVKATLTLRQSQNDGEPFKTTLIVAYTLVSGQTAEEQLFERDMAQYRTMLVAEQRIAGENI